MNRISTYGRAGGCPEKGGASVMARIRKFLDISTAHLDAPSRAWLTCAATDESAYEGFYGWFACVYRSPESPVQIAADSDRPAAALTAIFSYAIEHDCDYVLDAEIDPALEVFETDGEPAS